MFPETANILTNTGGMHAREKHLYIDPRKVLISAFIIAVLLRIPRSFLGIPYIYSIRYVARTLGDEMVTFGITTVDVAAIFIGILLYTQRIDEKTRYWPFILCVIGINAIRFLLGMTNMFSMHSYEVILSMIVGFSCATVIQQYYRTSDEIESFFDVMIGVFFLSQLYFILIGKAGRSGSYGTVGVGSGGLAVCYTTYLLLKLLNHTKDRKSIALMLASCVGLILTGSRTQLLLLIVFAGFYVLFMTPMTSSQKWLLVITAGVGAACLFAFYDKIPFLANNKKIQSMMNLMTSGFVSYISGDASASERFSTWTAALRVIGEHPLGIACSALDLQNKMFRQGSPTFPHSYLLAYYLLLGVPALFVYGSFWRLTIESRKYRTGVTLLMAYLMLILTFYGGLATYYVMFFWLVMLYEYVKKKVAVCRDTTQETTNADTGTDAETLKIQQ